MKTAEGRAFLLLANALGCSIERDNEGQLLIFTGMAFPDDDSPVHTLDDAVSLDQSDVPVHEIPAAVHVHGESDGLRQFFSVSGDVRELTYFLTPHQKAVLELSLLSGYASENYAIVPWAQRTFPDVQLDPEHSCFYAYTEDADEAQRLADAINNLEWAVPA